MKTNQDLLVAIVIVVWAIAIAVAVGFFVGDSDMLQTVSFGINIFVIFLFIGLIVLQDHSPKFKEWLRKPLKKDEEK